MNQMVQVNPGVASVSGFRTDFKNEVEAKQYFAEAIKKQLRGKKALFVVGSVVVLALITPLVWAAVTAGLGLAVLALLLVGAGVAWKWIPNLFLKVENRIRESNQREMNRHLAALKAEARKNPIEQLQNYLQLKAQQLTSYETFVSQVGTQVRSIGDMLTTRKREKPDRDYSKKDEALAAMQRAYKFHLGKAEAGRMALAALKEAVEDAKFDYQFGKVGQAAMQHMQALEGQDLLNEMLAAESFSSVRDNFNQVFSEIEVQIGTINSAKQLDFGEGVSLDVSGIHIPSIKEIQHVER
jgi:hypothetical protein